LNLFEKRGFEAIDTSGQTAQWWDFFLHRVKATSSESYASEKLFVECKYYAHERPGIRELSELCEQAKSLPPDCRALIATNTRLTSVARDWLARHESDGGLRLDVLDGPELTRWLLSTPETTSVVEHDEHDRDS
jgi:hypothetical protein